MSKSSAGGGVSTGFAKCFILFMACVILIQGAAYTGLAIWGITRSNCNEQTTDITEQPFSFAFDLVYFTGKECGQPSVLIEDNPFAIPVDLSKTAAINNRLEIFLITYAAVSGLWVVTSLLVIATICGPVSNLTVNLSYWPWLIVVMAGSVLDAVATGYHITDIINTASIDKLFQYLGIEANAQLSEFLDPYGAYFMSPALVLTCISSRVLVIWLLNIFGSVFCLSLSNVLKQGSSTVTATSSGPSPPSNNNAYGSNDFNNDAGQPSNNVVARQQSVAPQEQQMQQQQQQPQQWQQPPYMTQEQPMEQFATPRQSVPVRILPPPPTAYQQQQPQQQPQQQQQGYDGNVRQRRHPDYNAQPSDARPKLQINEAQPTYRNTDTHPDRIDYPTQATTPQTMSPLTQVSVVSPLNNRYSSNDGPFANQQGPSGQPARISQELRGQLPWSYTGNAAPMAPRKPHVQIYPDIPEPDYGDN